MGTRWMPIQRSPKMGQFLQRLVQTQPTMKPTLNIATVIFAGAAIAQIFIPHLWPQSITYCVCAWILSKVKDEI